MIMDKDFSSVGTQYIICECGDNFPNENFLSIHLANGHGEVDTFLCDACPEAFTSENLLLQHRLTHKPETPKKPELTTQKSPQVTPEKKKEYVKKPPVIKVQNLKKINSISLIQNLKTYGRFIKLEPEPPQPPEAIVPAEVQLVEEPAQVMVKLEAEVEDEGDAEDSTEEIYYQCDVCNAIFYTELDFNVHYQSLHAIKLEAQSTEEILEEHLVTDHADDATVKAGRETVYYYECEVCHKIFANEKYFNIHYNKAHGGLLPVEEEPSEIEGEEQPPEEPLSERLEELKDFVIEDTKPKAPEQVVYYKCDLCKILYPSEKAYNTHFDKKHAGASCQEISTGYRVIEQQLTPCQPGTSAEVYSCEFCPKSFNIKRSLQVHRKRVHFEQVKETDGLAALGSRAANRSKVCDICGRAYNSNAALRYHQRRHTGEKPYPCTICPKRFTMPMFLQIHMRTHTGEKPYECPHCPKAFTNKAALIRHDRVHSGVKPYPCPECGKFFTQSNSMKLHVSTVHLKLPAPYKSRSRRNKSEARALQMALKGLSTDGTELILGD